MLNKFFNYNERVVVVINCSSEFKKTLVAGKDYIYVDASSISEMQLLEGEYWMLRSGPNDSIIVMAKQEDGHEIRLSRLLMDVLKEPASLVTYANNCSYDLRKENLILYRKGRRNFIESERLKRLQSLNILPDEIENALFAENGSSLLKEHLHPSPSPVKIKEEVIPQTYNLVITLDGGNVKLNQLTEEERVYTTEFFRSIGNKITVTKS